MDISIIHPSRSRPQKSYETIQKWITSSVGLSRPEIIISLDSNDPYIQDYLNLYRGQFIISVDHNKSSVDAINTGAKKASGNILMVVSDDTEPINFWDEKIILETIGKKDWIIKTKDGIQDWIITFPILDIAYYNRTGYIYHPDFQHMFCDTYMTCVADINGRKITSDLLFKHNHYSASGGKEAPDAINKKNDATWSQGEETFIRLMKEFTPEELARITDIGMKRWLRNKVW